MVPFMRGLVARSWLVLVYLVVLSTISVATWH